MAKQWNVKELQPGQYITDHFRLEEVQERKTKTGSAYLTCKLVDATGAVDAKLWGVDRGEPR